MSSDKKQIYDVTSTSCTCADFMYRQSRVGGKCKHMIKYFPEEVDTTTNNIDELRKMFPMDIDIAYNKLGEEKLNQLIEIGEIIKQKNKFVLLE